MKHIIEIVLAATGGLLIGYSLVSTFGLVGLVGIPIAFFYSVGVSTFMSVMFR